MSRSWLKCRVLKGMFSDERAIVFPHAATLLAIEGRPLERPERFAPDPTALAWHRERVFRQG